MTLENAGLRSQRRSTTRKLARRAALNVALKLLALIVTALAAHDAANAATRGGASPCDAKLVHDIPARPADAPGWRGLAPRVASIEGEERERLIGEQLARGNLPSFLRRLRPVTFEGRLAGGRPVHVVTCVTPDYLAVGSDDDHMLVPMALAGARALAQRFGFLLPTRRIVDAVHAQADVRLLPSPLPAGDRMRSTEYFVRHDRMIEAQRAATGASADALTAGHKKDIVLTPALWRNPGQIAIYGWHRADGRPIQPLSTVHGARYADYSHGVRLVSATAFVDGAARRLTDLLADPEYSRLLSDEGPMPRVWEWLAQGR